MINKQGGIGSPCPKPLPGMIGPTILLLTKTKLIDNFNTNYDPLTGETNFQHKPLKIIPINFVISFANVKL